MSLKDTITSQMKEAMKARDSETLLTLRLILSELKNFEIDNGPQDDAGLQKIITKMVKQWKDAINDYKKGDRQDLIDEAQTKLDVLGKFLPQQMSEEEVRKIVQEVVDSMPEAQPGPATGMVMKKVAGKLDGAMVSRLVRELLSK